MTTFLKTLLLLSILSALNSCTYAYFFRDTKYEILYDCATAENCWSFLKGYMLEMLHEHQDTDRIACEDFFAYANGNYYSSRKEASFFELVDTHYTDEVIDVLNNFHGKEYDDTYFLHKTINDYLKQCLDNEDVDRSPIFEGLDKAPNLNWPNWTLCLQVAEWDEPLIDWIQLLGELRGIGLNNVFFKERVTVAYNDANKLIIELSMPDEMPPFDVNEAYKFSWYNVTEFRNPELRTVVDYINEFNKLFLNIRARHISDIGTIDELEIVTLAELKQKIPAINWDTYFKALLQRPIDAATFEIQLRNTNYLKDIATLIDQTEEKVIAFNILLRFIDFYDSITPHFHHANCQRDVIKLFAIGTNYLHKRFVERNNEKDKHLLETIFEDLKMNFASKLQTNKLNFTQTELDFLQQKLKGLKLQIGNTPLERPAKFYNSYYVPTIMSLPYVENVRNLRRFFVKKLHDRLFEDPATTDLEYFFAYDDTREESFEPHFVPQRNVVIVPQQFLRVPYFSRGLEEVFQHSITGFGLARALMTAFSTEGIIFDANGNESEIGKGIVLLPAYQNALSCLRNVSEYFTQARMSDIMGFRLVIDTYYNQLPTVGDEAKMSVESDKKEISFSMLQLFFQSFAQYFGGYDQYLPSYVTILDTPKTRLLAIVSQTPEFRQFYECASDSSNEKKICELW